MIDHSLLGSVIQLEGYNLDFLLVYFSEQLVIDRVPETRVLLIGYPKPGFSGSATRKPGFRALEESWSNELKAS